MRQKLVLGALVASVVTLAACGRVQQLKEKATEVANQKKAEHDSSKPPVSGQLIASTRQRNNVVEATDHPRLYIRKADLPKFRSWAKDSNPVFKDGLKAVIDEAVKQEAAGILKDDPASPNTSTQHATEAYAALFAFWSLIAPTEKERDTFAKKAHKILMSAINEAVKGPAEEKKFRDPRLSIADRARWSGHCFPLTVDWIYPQLSADDKKKIRTVFLRWASEIEKSETTTHNHPEPRGVINDPKLIADKYRTRWSGNNHYLGHMRNLGLMGLSFDAADDPEGKLRSKFQVATGAFLYVTDHLMRNDMKGGMGAEGFEYSQLAMGYVAELLLATFTAGKDDPAKYGRQVTFEDNDWWNHLIPGYLHSLSPTSKTPSDGDLSYMGDVYQVAWFGDGEKYWAPDFMPVFGPMGLYDSYTNNTARNSAIRWIETNMAPGGAEKLIARASDANDLMGPIIYFLLFDPNAPAPMDPHPGQPLQFFSEGLGRYLQRTSWNKDASWFSYRLGWVTLDHMFGDGNMFELWRKGEWLTKERTGYGDDIACSDQKNSITIENDKPVHSNEEGYRKIIWKRGSQWAYVASGDPTIVAKRFGPDFTYFLGDSTNLYNSQDEKSEDVVHASRSIVWLVPDRIVTYDRAQTKKDHRFKRYWLQLPNQGHVADRLMSMKTDGGQHLYVRSLLPEKASLSVEPVEPLDNANGKQPALLDPIKFRFKVEATGGPKSTRFLHVLQGADANQKAEDATLVRSTAGTPYEGAAFHDTVVMFPVDIGKFQSVTYSAPANTKAHLVTGLSPGAGYKVTKNGNETTVTTGGDQKADSGGVLVIGQLPK